MAPQIPTLWETVEENHQRPFAFDHGTQPDAIRLDLLDRALFHVFPPVDGYDVVTLGEGHLTPQLTASRPHAPFRVFLNRNRAALRWSAMLGASPFFIPSALAFDYIPLLASSSALSGLLFLRFVN